MKKKSQNSLKWLIGAGILFILGLSVFAGTILYVDPFFQYHKRIPQFPYVVDNQMSQNPGMAKTFDYDSVILGSSLTVGFHADWFEELFGEKPVKLNYNGAYPKDLSNILSIVFKHNKNVRTVYYGLDPLNFPADTQQTKYEVPTYLYDDNLLNDVSYLFNKDVLLQYIIKPLFFPGEKTDLNTVYHLSFTASEYNAERVLAGFTRAQKESTPVAIETGLQACEANLEQNVFPFLEQNPNTKFVFFVPPYSILYWDNIVRQNRVDNVFAIYEDIIGHLLEYQNVEVYFFADCTDIITDLDQYADYTHYNETINRYMAECFANGDNQMTQSNYHEILDRLTEFVVNYPYDSSIFKGEE